MNHCSEAIFLGKDDLKAIRQKPNQNLIKAIETALEHAKSGDLQGMLYIDYWDSDMTSHGWVLPHRYRIQKTTLLLGEMHKAMADLANELNGIDSEIIKGG